MNNLTIKSEGPRHAKGSKTCERVQDMRKGPRMSKKL